MRHRNERRAYPGILFLVCLLAASACDRSHDFDRVDCEIDQGPCVRELSEERLLVTFDVTPKPVRMMSNVVFAVTLSEDARPLEDASVTLGLSMPGMYMGPNSLPLLHVGNGRYEGKGIIVRCGSGRRVWKAGLSVRRPDQGEDRSRNVSFIFLVNE